MNHIINPLKSEKDKIPINEITVSFTSRQAPLSFRQWQKGNSKHRKAYRADKAKELSQTS